MIRKIAWMVLFVGVTAAFVYGAPQSGSDKSAMAQTVTGCLQKGHESGGFFIIGENDKHWELYPAGDVSLAEHLGHTVTVTGTVAHRSPAQEEKSQPHEKKEMGKKQHADLQVSAVTMVSTSCSK